MRQLLLAASLTVALGAYAQAQDLSFDQPLVTKVIDPTQADIAIYARIQNSSDFPLNVRWIREVNSLPAGWASAVCDTNQCYLPRVDSADFRIEANADAPIIPHIYPDGTPGSGQVSVRVFEIDERSNSAMATFQLTETSSARGAYGRRGARLYPNPGNETFRVISDEPVARVTLTNMLGKVVRDFAASGGEFDVRDLPDGIYLATLTGQRGQVIKTLRYSKRAVRP